MPKSIEEFLAAVPDAPSSEVKFEGVDPEAAASEADPPKAQASPTSTSPSASTSKEKAGPGPGSAESTSTSPDLEAVKAALRAGDLDALGDLLDEDPALFDEKTPKWASRKRHEEKTRREMAEVTTKAERIVQRFAPVDGFLGRIEAGDYSALPELVEHLGQDWDSAAMKAFRARRGADPRVPALEARAAKAEAEAAEGRTARQAQADKLFYETIRDEVDEANLVRKIDGWEARVADVLRESVDETGDPKLSVKQAAARVLRKEREDFNRKAAVFGEAPAPRTSRASTPERASGASGATKRKITRDEWLAAQK
jgi:hypothetical protein